MSSPNLHDARLLGMFVSDNKTATVLFRSENGQRHELLLKEVEHLVANDFREGNIVLDVEIYDGESFDSKLLSEIYGKNYLTAHPGFESEIRRKVKNGELKLVSVNPSYGCSHPSTAHTDRLLCLIYHRYTRREALALTAEKPACYSAPSSFC
jgi:hypothetical protein